MKYGRVLTAVLCGLMLFAGASDFAAAAAKSSAGQFLDGFEVPDWNTANHEKATIGIETASGKKGQSLKIKYTLRDPKQWVAINKAFNLGNTAGKAMEIWLKGEGKANTLEMHLVDEDSSVFVVKLPAITNAKDWTRLVFNVDDFMYGWGGDNKLDNVKNIDVAISGGEGGSGVVYLDELRVIPAQAVKLPSDGTLDKCDSIVGWEQAAADGAALQMTVKNTDKGKALLQTYSLPADQWISVRKRLGMALDPNATISFNFKGEGASNNLEFKLIDKDGSIFGKIYNGLGSSGGWKEMRISIPELQYMWGGDNKLDLSFIRYIEFVMSGPGGDGVVTFNNLKVTK